MRLLEKKQGGNGTLTALAADVAAAEHLDRSEGPRRTGEARLPVRASTRLMGLLGADIRHADLAFGFNNRLLSLWGSEFLYLPYSVPGTCLEDAVQGIRALDILSANVTFPHKVSILKYLDRIDDAAREMGSVNLVVNRQGELWGYNTDSEGFMYALRRGGGVSYRPGAPGLDSALIYGCGGAGRALAVALARAGVRQIWLHDIVQCRCSSLEIVRDAADGLNGYRVSSMPRQRLAELRPELIVNATPAGRGEQAEISPLDEGAIAEGITGSARLFFDLNYNPPRSQFLRQAEQLGIATENGLRMMCYQAKRSIEVAVGKEIPADWYAAAVRSAGLDRFLVSAAATTTASALP